MKIYNVIWSGGKEAPSVYMGTSFDAAIACYQDWRKTVNRVADFNGDLVTVYVFDTTTQRKNLVVVNDADMSPIPT